MKSSKTILVTGASARIGAVIADQLHATGYNIIIHYRSQHDAAEKLCQRLNQTRKDSAAIIQADLQTAQDCAQLIEASVKIFSGLHGLIHNASSFFATPTAQPKEDEWNNLFNSNAKAAYFLACHAYAELKANNGWIINISDINAKTPLKNYSIYCAAKAAQNSVTQSLALEMAPNVRVNAIAIGTTIWPSDNNATTATEKSAYINSLPLKRMVSPTDIAQAVMFLAEQETITGQILTIDSGKSIGNTSAA